MKPILLHYDIEPRRLNQRMSDAFLPECSSAEHPVQRAPHTCRRVSASNHPLGQPQHLLTPKLQRKGELRIRFEYVGKVRYRLMDLIFHPGCKSAPDQACISSLEYLPALL